jgi:hypothetical protein
MTPQERIVQLRHQIETAVELAKLLRQDIAQLPPAKSDRP